jgi:hypothetical protein
MPVALLIRLCSLTISIGALFPQCLHVKAEVKRLSAINFSMCPNAGNQPRGFLRRLD